MFKKILVAAFVALITFGGLTACKTAGLTPANQNAISYARQKLEELSEPTFESLEVYTHDLSAKGVTLLLTKYPDSKVPLRVFADSALSILENQQATMVDLIAISNSLDNIKEGKVKVYLDIAWTLLELNGVIRRNDLTATLTAREQRLVIALCQGIRLGTGPAEETNRVLNSYGPRYGNQLPKGK